MTLPNIPAVETIYKGNRYRSRTEAKWAVFFDLVKVPYEYEVQGVDLPSGRYLPDFWLPTQEVWFEVKGSWDAVGDLSKYAELCAMSGHFVIVAAGPPSAVDNMLVLRPKPLFHGGVAITLPFENVDAHLHAGECRFLLRGDDLAFRTPAGIRYGRDGHWEISLIDRAVEGGCRDCDRQLKEAGFSRFEHGERGARAGWERRA